MATKIKSIEHLKKEAINGCDCFISLMGCLRSSKQIWYDKNAKQFKIFNLIDDSEQVLSETEIMDKDLTNIGHAIINGALYKDN
jgi:hypothetical protein